MIRFEQVTKSYPAAGGRESTTAVDHLSLEAPTGQITVFVGPSGCGKTTSLRMINRMIEPTSGQILIDDRDVTSVNASELRRGIGYVIQHAGLFPHKKIVDNVATVPLLNGWDKRKARDRAHEVLELVGLPGDFADRYPSQLSGGQQQRVGVARALAADPPVMLMDEPFSAVDPVVRDQLQDEFLRLQSEIGKTIIFVTHDIDEAIKLGDQVAVLRVGGKLAQIAEPSYLLAHPIDDFVADFVGRDRGYRALAFTDAPDLRLADEPTVPLGTTPEQARAATRDGWLLVVDDGRPQGWVEPHRIEAPIEQSMLHRGGTVARARGPLRASLDAALSSPSRRGVLVDDDGRLVGTVRAHEVLHAIEEVDRPEVHDEDIAPTSAAGD
ncbi:ABC transporter ATP-binding protein [Luteipulveratus halotolerans]|uniref:ABC-type quaternary amine transporter n=1 Tax=Luteipulveratus halotolerans TaxID=1631356 RepID=A0A0L6CEK7_9MICO|nr:ATP-binding cassette domain-containing protein [Luteipulveratus halotolerans]KNX35995.1 glycine/betaine ABC transporter ATPase [Luteipulveratus halotolerans]